MLQKSQANPLRQEIAADLGAVHMFRDLDYQALEDIGNFCGKLRLMPGDELISERINNKYDLYVLCTGKVEIISSHSGVTSEEVSLSRQDKEIFGEISWLTGNNRTATIRCLGEVDALRIDGQQFMEYLDKHPQVGFIVMKNMALLLAGRLKQTDNLLKQILWNSHI